MLFCASKPPKGGGAFRWPPPRRPCAPFSDTPKRRVGVPRALPPASRGHGFSNRKACRWAPVGRMSSGSWPPPTVSTPREIRDHAILLLFALYAFRSGEVAALRLDDLHWEREVIAVACPKQRRAQEYPLVPMAGEAI